jgi:hypothetical protein
VLKKPAAAAAIKTLILKAFWKIKFHSSIRHQTTKKEHTYSLSRANGEDTKEERTGFVRFAKAI